MCRLLEILTLPLTDYYLREKPHNYHAKPSFNNVIIIEMTHSYIVWQPLVLHISVYGYISSLYFLVTENNPFHVIIGDSIVS